MTITRRSFLGRTGALAAAGAALPSWMPRLAFRPAGQPARGDVLVAIFQRGGMDGLSAVIPYQERQYFDLRNGISFRAPTPGDPKSAIRLDDQFALNPGLVGLKGIWDTGQLAVIHATGSPDPTRSHFEAMDTMERGSQGTSGVNTGWLGRHLASTASQMDSPFRAIGWGSMLQQSLRGPVPIAALQSIADFHLQGRPEALAAFRAQLEALYAGGDWFDETAEATFTALDMLEKANPLQYQPQNGATYPDTAFGQGLKQIAQLIKADIGLEVACIDLGGWDTHANMVWINYNDPTRGQMYNLLTQLDQGITAFHRDLGSRFVDPGVTLVTMSEFGRRVGQNSANGTDHGHGNCMFVVSGAAVGGMHVDWPTLEPAKLDNGDLAITTDYRDVLSEIVAKRLHNTRLDEVFPGYTPHFRDVVRDSTGTVVPTATPYATHPATAEPTREPTRTEPTREPTRRPTEPGGERRNKIYLPQARKYWPDSR
jgi:uncharacterized protein (DUF1501 family)